MRDRKEVKRNKETKYSATPPIQQIFLPPRFWVVTWPAATRVFLSNDQGRQRRETLGTRLIGWRNKEFFYLTFSTFLTKTRFLNKYLRFKQQRQQHQRQRRLKKRHLTYESREKLDSFTLTILSEIAETDYVRQRQNFDKEIFKN